MFWKTSYAEENFKSSRFLQRKYEKNIGKDFERNKKKWACKTCKTKRKKVAILGTNSMSMKRLLILLMKEIKLKISKMKKQ